MVRCPSCAAGLRFDIESQKMVCDHCDSRYEPDKVSSTGSDEAKSVSLLGDCLYICPNCGAELITTDDNDAVGFCPFCDGASMIHDKIRQDWVPDCIIPFKITKEQCIENYVAKAKQSVFISGKFRKSEYIDAFRGIYMPYWRYNSQINGDFLLKSSIETKSDSITDQLIETFYYDITGRLYFHPEFYHDASLAFDDSYSEKIAPFHLDDEVPFVSGYVSGFYAEVGNVHNKEYEEEAKEHLTRYTVNALKKDEGFKEALGEKEILPQQESLPIRFSEMKQALYPVWFMRIRRGKETTYAAVNGQTGKVSANFTLSSWRVLLAALVLSCPIMALLVLISPAFSCTTFLGACSFLLIIGYMVTKGAWNRTIFSVLDMDTGRMKVTREKRKSALIAIILLIITIFLTTARLEIDIFIRVVIYIAVFSFFISPFINFFKTIIDYSKDSGAIKDELRKPLYAKYKADLAKRIKKYLILNNVVWCFAAALIIGWIVVIINSNQDTFWTTVFCAAMMTLLFIAAAMFIIFQKKVAVASCKRQFKKEGAEYDEN